MNKQLKLKYVLHINFLESEERVETQVLEVESVYGEKLKIPNQGEKCQILAEALLCEILHMEKHPSIKQGEGMAKTIQYLQNAYVDSTMTQKRLLVSSKGKVIGEEEI